MPKYTATTVHLDPAQKDSLRLLSEKSKVPVAEYIRQGIDQVLEREARRSHSEDLQTTMTVKACCCSIMRSEPHYHIDRTTVIPWKEFLNLLEGPTGFSIGSRPPENKSE
jgi:hypothetical protein